MSYIDETLMPGEKIILRARPHWIIFSTPAAYLMIALILFIFGHHFTWLNEAYFWHLTLYQFASLVLLVMSIVLTISIYIAYQTSEFGITDKRVLVKIGLVHRASLEVYFDRIESVTLYQTILARLLNYGTLLIHGIGGSVERLRHIPNPSQFRLLVLEQVEHFDLQDHQSPAAKSSEPS